MKSFINLMIISTLCFILISCAEESNPIDNTPDWSDKIIGKWEGVGFYGPNDTLKITMDLNAVKNEISGTADVSYNDESEVKQTVNGTISDNLVTLTFKNIKDNIDFTGSFLATNPGIIDGTMLNTRYQTMPVTFYRK